MECMCLSIICCFLALLGKLQSLGDSDIHSIIFVCQTCGKGFHDENELTQHNFNRHASAGEDYSKEDHNLKGIFGF